MDVAVWCNTVRPPIPPVSLIIGPAHDIPCGVCGGFAVPTVTLGYAAETYAVHRADAAYNLQGRNRASGLGAFTRNLFAG